MIGADLISVVLDDTLTKAERKQQADPDYAIESFVLEPVTVPGEEADSS